MAIKFRCPTCHELYSAQDDMAGAEVTCPMCEARFELAHGEKPKPRAKPQAEAAKPQPTVDVADDAAPVAISFRRRDGENHNELDMTPMVDVTFLLLIFFMVTAAFGLQKSYDVPAPDDSRPSTEATTLEELESDPKYVIVRIDQYDTFHVSAAAWEMEQEAPSKPDLLAKLRQAKSSGASAATHLLVMASEDATNGQVVTALDAGAATGMEDVKLMTMPAE